VLESGLRADQTLRRWHQTQHCLDAYFHHCCQYLDMVLAKQIGRHLMEMDFQIAADLMLGTEYCFF